MSREAVLFSALYSAGFAWLPSRLAGSVCAALCGAGGLVATYGLADSAHFDVAGVHIEGQRNAGPVEIRHLANIPVGTKLWSVDLERVAEGISEHPWVASVHVERNWPNEVLVHVEEYSPVSLLQHHGLYYVDSEGEVFKRARTDDLDYPILTGLDADWADTHPAVARRIVSDAVAVLSAVDNDTLLSSAAVSEVRFSPDTGFAIVLRNGTELGFGFGEPTGPMKRLHRMLQTGLDLSLEAVRIDLSAQAVAVLTPLGEGANARSNASSP